MINLNKSNPGALAMTALAILLALTGCAARQKSAAASPGTPPGARGPGIAEIAVQVAAVSVDSLVVQHQASGTVNPAMESQVVAQVGGVVARVVRKAGDFVQAGDTVIQLDDSQLQLSVKTAQAAVEAARINLSTGQDTTAQASPKLDLQVQSAESALSVAQRNFDSRKALFDLGGATGADLDRAKSDLETAKANLEAARTAQDQNRKSDVQDIAQLKLAVQQAEFALQQAQLNLQHASIRAPYSGRLVSVKMMPGEYASQNVPAFIIGSREREIDFSVSPADTAALPRGAAITFTLNGARYPLKVTQSSEVPLNGVVPLVAALPDSLPLTFGAVGTVSYPVTLARGALVQTGALQTNEDQNFVYVVEGGKALARPITILAESGNSAAVTGVSAGSLVVVNPPPGLLDGSLVKPLPLPAEGNK
ncbi:MAG: efflux RND transporter periplasmic adaptor subunit [Spirochaetia bacterium]